jgi:SAM-dependent methyltransferase
MTAATLVNATPDYAAIKGRQKQTWGSGDYHVIASIIVPMAERLCDAVDLRAGQRILDVATGSGNAAIAASRRMCEVTGVDYEPGLLERGRQRAAVEGFYINFLEGDAESLPVADSAFDVVLSTVGTMFAPNQEQTAAEMLRACRAGGQIGIASWTPEGWIGEMFRVVGRHVPPPAGLRPGTRWGSEEGVRELFAADVTELRMVRRNQNFNFTSTQQFLDLFRDFYGPVLKAFAALDAIGQDALARDLIDAAERYNRSGDDTLMIPAEYLEVVAIKA